MRPQVVTIHQIFSDAIMPPNINEIKEMMMILVETVRVSLNEGQGPGQKAKHLEYVKPPSYLRSHEKILIGVAAKGGKQGFTCSEDSECFKVKRRIRLDHPSV
ncbi:hypothetical protein Bca4012_024468 [Brassica carinata]